MRNLGSTLACDIGSIHEQFDETCGGVHSGAMKGDGHREGDEDFTRHSRGWDILCFV